jgi:putative transposase
MGRSPRINLGGLVYHVLNRANARQTIFDSDADYQAWECVLEEAVERARMRLLAYVAMPNHWHLVAWPRNDGDLSRFVGWLTLTHTQRWHAHRHSVGQGHLYQGRFKSFVTQSDEHLLTVCRYVERNPLRAKLVEEAEAWRWSSLWRWLRGDEQQRRLLAAWPVARPGHWLRWVNRVELKGDLAALRQATQRGNPFGEPTWMARTVRKLGLETTLRPRGRPRAAEKGS